MHRPRLAFWAGLQAIAPILLGIVPFATIAGAAAVGAGLPETLALGLSVIVYAGASQLAALELVRQDAPVFVIVGTALIINLRFLMYSASLAPHFQALPLRWRSPLAYVLTDQAYAVSVSRFTDDAGISRGWYYLGAAVPMWITWQASNAVGVFLGAQVPPSWSLDFAIPLTFLALLVPALKSRPAVLAALVSAGVAVGAAALPLNLGLLLAAFAGIGAGLLADQHTRSS